MLYTMGQIVRYIGTTNSAPHAVISLPHARPKATLAVDPLGGGRDLAKRDGISLARARAELAAGTRRDSPPAKKRVKGK